MTTENFNLTAIVRQHFAEDMVRYRCAQRLLVRRSLGGIEWDVIWEGKQAIGKSLAWRLDMLGGLLGEW
ncbi:hypothetical protein [Herbaspirillum seropedicae]|uniref:hypothetical protein n=1 Tax=Herbaspirillum seropedicae TaxID=964 RepID=UPI003D99487D